MVDIDGKLTYSKIEVVKPVADMLVSIAPNPVHDHIIVSSQDNIKVLIIMNSQGQTVKSIALSGMMNRQKIEIKELPAGLYFVKAAGEKEIWTGQFIKQ
jgi:hypothetical protein